MEFIGEIADLAADVLTKMGMRVRYPAIVTADDGKRDNIDGLRYKWFEEEVKNEEMD